MTALNEGRGDFFAVVNSLALFVNALHQDDAAVRRVEQQPGAVHRQLTDSDHDLANAVQQIDSLLSTVRPFLDKNREVLTHDVNNLADRDRPRCCNPSRSTGWRPALHVLPTAASNVNQIYHPAHGVGHRRSGDHQLRQPDAVPLQRRFRPVAGSAIRNPPNFVRSIWRRSSMRSSSTTSRSDSTCSTPPRRLPKQVAYSETAAAAAERLQGHHRPGHLGARYAAVAPQHSAGLDRRARHAGVKVGPITAGLLTPESLAELMGGPDIAPVQSTLQTPPGPPNAYDENPILPPIGVPGSGTGTAAAAGPGGYPGSRRSDPRARFRTATRTGRCIAC